MKEEEEEAAAVLLYICKNRVFGIWEKRAITKREQLKYIKLSYTLYSAPVSHKSASLSALSDLA